MLGVQLFLTIVETEYMTAMLNPLVAFFFKYAPSNFENLPFELQAGFFLVQYAHLWQDHLDKLFDLYASGKLKVCFLLITLCKYVQEGIARQDNYLTQIRLIMLSRLFIHFFSFLMYLFMSYHHNARTGFPRPQEVPGCCFRARCSRIPSFWQECWQGSTGSITTREDMSVHCDLQISIRFIFRLLCALIHHTGRSLLSFNLRTMARTMVHSCNIG